MDETEPFDWTPEVDLVKGLVLPARVQVILDYLDAARERASARSQMFARVVLEDTGLAGEDLAALLRDDPHFAALFEVALGASARSAHEQKIPAPCQGCCPGGFEIHVPEPPEVTATLLSDVTARYQLSAGKGTAGMAWLAQADISMLMQSGVFMAIRELTTPRSKELLRALRRLREAGAVDDELADIAAHWGGRSEHRHRSADQLTHIPRSVDALERLSAAGWAQRGLRFDCPACGLPNFVPLTQAQPQATCPGCAAPGTYHTENALAVSYRLSSHLDLLSDQGVLPHLLTIAVLQAPARSSHFMPGIDVWFSTGDSDHAEVDIFGIRDGKVLSGEVKTSASEFTDEQISRDVQLSAQLRADIHVLAATSDIPPQAAKKAGQLCKENSLELIILGQRELLPFG